MKKKMFLPNQVCSGGLVAQLARDQKALGSIPFQTFSREPAIVKISTFSALRENGVTQLKVNGTFETGF